MNGMRRSDSLEAAVSILSFHFDIRRIPQPSELFISDQPGA
jgi:hypothetical protein